MKTTYDPESNCAYVGLTEYPVNGTVEASPGVLIDLDEEGDVRGIELIGAKPRPRLARVLADYELAHLLDDIYAQLDTATGVQVGGRMKLGQVRVG